MPSPLQVEVVPVPCADAQSRTDAALNELADALADRFIQHAKEQIASELGVPVEALGPSTSRSARAVGGRP